MKENMITRKEQKNKHLNAVSLKNKKDRERMDRYMAHLATPGPQFDAHNFYTKALLLIEHEIKEYLSSNNRNTNKSTFTLIEYAKKLHPNESLWDSIHDIRQIRNKYSHELEKNEEKQKLIENFLSHSERATKYNGKDIFPVTDKENQQQLRVYIAVSNIWEYLCRLNGAPGDFSPTSEILTTYENILVARLEEIEKD